MPNVRATRYSDFDKFKDDAEQIFKALSADDEGARHLDEFFTLNICPGGRSGGLNKRVVEIFYGNRPYDSAIEIGANAGLIERLQCAHGATLAYYRSNEGHVLCNLYPAGTDNQRALEDGILLDSLREPINLRTSVRSHWRSLVAYMEVTCLDGKPTRSQRIRVWYLRNFRRCIIDSKARERKVASLAKEVLKWVLTVGLSGSALMVISKLQDNGADESRAIQFETAAKALEASATELKMISRHTERTASNLEEILKSAAGREKDGSGGDAHGEDPAESKTREKFD